ncbi:MAG TPA: YbhB/YbcL family Raf kinase inhibitor-like protein [Candidatus Competibacteraceae bacterium]|nr:YbhB/YbcL family Raf kinase inhibitor-like protein [Candidatus Competibacteraceae bacterium]
MQLTSPAFQDQQLIPEEYAFGVHDPHQHVALGPNRNPPLEWRDLPPGTRSLVLICHDRDVPSRPDDVNREGRIVPASLPRVDFFHWVLVDLPPQPARIEAGEFSNGVTPRGKPGPEGPRGTRQGINNYREWFADDPNMAGNYFGYDGPCPPWNDTIVHHYVFTLYALDLERCPVSGLFTGPQVLDAIQGHILDQASLTGTYTLNLGLRS